MRASNQLRHAGRQLPSVLLVRPWQAAHWLLLAPLLVALAGAGVVRGDSRTAGNDTAGNDTAGNDTAGNAVAESAVSDPAAAEHGSAGDSLEARRLQISRMSPGEQQELLRKQERFLALPPAEQDRLRALQAAIDADEHAEKLHEILVRYHEWLKTLTPAQRAELADSTPEDRVRLIKKFKVQQHIARQQQHLAELLTSDDFREILRWTESVIWANREPLFAEMDSSRRESMQKLDTPQQRRALMAYAFERSRRGTGSRSMSIVTEKDIAKLSEKLSDSAKTELTQAPDLSAQRRMLGGWVRMAMHRLETWQAARRLAPLVGEDLVQFFQHDLKSQQREILLKMPQEQMREELRRLYLEHQRADVGLSGLEDPSRFDRNAPDRGKGGYRWPGRSPKGPEPGPTANQPAEAKP